MFASGVTTLIIFEWGNECIMKKVNSVEESGLLIKVISEKIKYKAKEQKGGFLGMLLDTLGASLLGNLLIDKRAIAMSQGRKANMPGRGPIRAGEDKIRAGHDF